MHTWNGYSSPSQVENHTKPHSLNPHTLCADQITNSVWMLSISNSTPTTTTKHTTQSHRLENIVFSRPEPDFLNQGSENHNHKQPTNSVSCCPTLSNQHWPQATTEVHCTTIDIPPYEEHVSPIVPPLCRTLTKLTLLGKAAHPPWEVVLS